MPRATSPGPLLLLFSLSFCACNRDVVRETGVHPDGSPAWERYYLAAKDGRKVSHGAHATWHPRGPRHTLEFFDRGVRQGYSFAWNERGDLIRLALCEDGHCRARPLPGKSARAAAALAMTKFR